MIGRDPAATFALFRGTFRDRGVGDRTLTTGLMTRRSQASRRGDWHLPGSCDSTVNRCRFGQSVRLAAANQYIAAA